MYKTDRLRMNILQGQYMHNPFLKDLQKNTCFSSVCFGKWEWREQEGKDFVWGWFFWGFFGFFLFIFYSSMKFKVL